MGFVPGPEEMDVVVGVASGMGGADESELAGPGRHVLAHLLGPEVGHLELLYDLQPLHKVLQSQLVRVVPLDVEHELLHLAVLDLLPQNLAQNRLQLGHRHVLVSELLQMLSFEGRFELVQPGLSLAHLQQCWQKVPRHFQTVFVPQRRHFVHSRHHLGRTLFQVEHSDSLLRHLGSIPNQI